jgi:hypothetical protein
LRRRAGRRRRSTGADSLSGATGGDVGALGQLTALVLPRLLNTVRIATALPFHDTRLNAWSKSLTRRDSVGSAWRVVSKLDVSYSGNANDRADRALNTIWFCNSWTAREVGRVIGIGQDPAPDVAGDASHQL